MDGQGTYFWPNGDIYEGQWKSGKYEGVGTLNRGIGPYKGEKY